MPFNSNSEANFETVVALPNQIDEIIAFETSKLRESVSDEMDRELASWNARWRKESLEHYLPNGWCFMIRESNSAGPGAEQKNSRLVGYFLAQPLLFLDGQTQSLWVEHLQYDSLQVRDELCDLAYKLARDKHLQKVYLPKSSATLNATKHLKADEWTPSMLELKTTKV